MITGGDLRQSRLDIGYKTFTISPWLPAAVVPDLNKVGDTTEAIHFLSIKHRMEISIFSTAICDG